VVVVLFGIAGAAALLRALALGNRVLVLDDPGGSGFAARARGADSFADTTDIALAAAVVVLAPCFIVWLWRAAKNQQALGREPERLGSGWAIGGWFIPLANFVIPVLVVQDLWRGSDVAIGAGDPRWRVAERSWLVGWWWGLFLVPLFAASGADADRFAQDVSEARGANFLALLAMVLLFVSTVLGALVVRRLRTRQEACRAALAR
jgi:membrane protease YdiL (CAAX protease family)